MIAVLLAGVLAATPVRVGLGPIGHGLFVAEMPKRAYVGMSLHAELSVAVASWDFRAGVELGENGNIWDAYNADNFDVMALRLAVLHRWPHRWFTPFAGGGLAYQGVVAYRSDLGLSDICPRIDCHELGLDTVSLAHLVPEGHAGVDLAIGLGFFAELRASGSLELLDGKPLFLEQVALGVGWSFGFGG